MRPIRPWKNLALNQVPDVENRIHSDEGARRYGFKGALVPGVTVSAYLMHPGAEAWGKDFAERGAASVKVEHPLYDNRAFFVTVGDAENASFDNAYRATLIDENDTACANGTVWLADRLPDPPAMRGDPIWTDRDRQALCSREEMERLRDTGLRAVRFPFVGHSGMASYLRDPEEMAGPFRPSDAGYANPAFMLGLTNWALATNVYLDAWLHLQTDHQYYAPVPPGAELIAESRITDLFNKKGHEFVDLEVNVFFEDGSAAMSARLRAIYKLGATKRNRITR